MIPLWVTGDSLARADILADEADSSKHSSVQELQTADCVAVCAVLCDGRHPFPAAALKNSTALNGRHLNI